MSNIAIFYPLFPKRVALSLYVQLRNDNQLDTGKIEAKLKLAFMNGDFSAYAGKDKVNWWELAGF